jgi:GDPmannose 4,6-dehydratase
MKKALVTGVTGQDGSYLVEFLLEKGYEVHGLNRRTSTPNDDRVNHLSKTPNFFMHDGDLTDSGSLTRLISLIKPDEIYNLGAQSHVGLSFDYAEVTADINALGPLRILEAIRLLGLDTKFYQASTSEMFGKVQEIPQSESTAFYPRSPYGVAKLYAYWITKNYRESYGMFACSGILFNHESPRRGDNFVTQKIVKGLHAISNNKQDCLYLGNLDAMRDWGHAKDFIEAMWMIVQQDEPDDFVIATGETHSVRHFIDIASKYFDMNIEWQGEGLDEIGIDTNTGNTVIRISPEFFRPAEVDILIGNIDKAITKLGWKPKMSFEELVEDMCKSITKESILEV